MLLELLKKRRSIRRYEDRAVEQDKVDLLLKAALLAPSSSNNKPWEFIVVDDRGLLQKLSVSKKGAALLAQAALAVVVMADTAKSDVWVEDVSIAATHVLLMAEELGLGACWVQIRRRFHDDKTSADVYVRDLLGIPPGYEVDCLIGVGYPAENKVPHDESELDFGKTFVNRYGAVKPRA